MIVNLLKKKILIFFILININFKNIFSFNLNWDNNITRAGHWAISAGPWFADAIHYVALFSEEYATQVFGNEDAEFEIESFVQHVLHECGTANSNKIKVKLIKTEARDFVLSAVICTDATIFINPSIYNFLSKNEKRALIAQAAIMMQKNHLGTNAAIMALIPLFTHFITEAAKNLLKNSFESSDFVKHNTFGKQIYKGAQYIAGCAPTKLLINSYLGYLYFKYQSKRYTDLTAKKLGSVEDLLSYQTKLQEFINKKKSNI